MGLETVKEELIRNAKQQESSLIAEARKEANKIMVEAEKKSEEMKEKGEAEAKKAIDAVKRQAVASAELEVKKMLLEAKKQAIENVFSEVRKKLDALDDKRREACTKKLLEKAQKEIEVKYIYCSKKDGKSLKGFEISSADIIGGIIAENKEKTIRVDYSFDTMLDAIKDAELENISKLLFG